MPVSDFLLPCINRGKCLGTHSRIYPASQGCMYESTLTLLIVIHRASEERYHFPPRRSDCPNVRRKMFFSSLYRWHRSARAVSWDPYRLLWLASAYLVWKTEDCRAESGGRRALSGGRWPRGLSGRAWARCRARHVSPYFFWCFGAYQLTMLGVYKLFVADRILQST